ncbi:hypothetical protein NHJ6243_004911 [Beauveria neobassiana]
MFVTLCCLLGKAAADSGNDFVNNLFTDLAPLLALFGERVTQQFMSQSTGWADHNLLSMAPLGIITAIVGAIRVSGPPWLKAVIGRARENFAVVESELLSSTSNEVCKVWNGCEIVRIMGKSPITEFICLVKENDLNLSMNPGRRMNVKFMTMDDATEQELIKRDCKNSQLSDVQRKPWSNGATDEEAARDDSSAVGRGSSIRGSGDGIRSDAGSNLPDGPSNYPISITSPATGVRAGESEAFESCHKSLPALRVEVISSPNAHKNDRECSYDDSDEQYINGEKDYEWDLLAAIRSERSKDSWKMLDPFSYSCAGPRITSYRPSDSPDSDDSVPTTEGDHEGTAAVGESRHGAESEPALPHVAVPTGEVPDIVVTRNSHHTTPNISMNCHKSFRRGSLQLAAGFAALLQIILIIYCSSTVYYWIMKSDGKPRRYGFPFTAGGLITLVAGMMVCAHVVESYTKESRYTVQRGRVARMIWLQQRQKVAEQVFDSCALYPPEAQEIIITSCQEQRSQPRWLEGLVLKLFRKVRENAPDPAQDATLDEKQSVLAARDEQRNKNKLESLTILEAKTFSGVTLALIGFFFQFTGIRALHWSVALTQLGAVGVLTILRVWVRRGFSKPPVHYNLIPGHELDWLAMALQHSDTLPWRKDKTELHLDKAWLAWGVATGSDLQQMHGSTSSTCLNWEVDRSHGEEAESSHSDEVESSHGEEVESLSPCETDDRLDTILPLRRDLAEASDWNGPLSPLAIKLAESLDAVMDLCFSDPKFGNNAQWDILLSPQKHHGARYARFHIRRENGQWQNQSDEIDAALSLWIFSLVEVRPLSTVAEEEIAESTYSQRQMGSLTNLRQGSTTNREELHEIMTPQTSNRISDKINYITTEPTRFKQLFQSAIIKQRGQPALLSPRPEPQRFLALPATDSLDRIVATTTPTGSASVQAVAAAIEHHRRLTDDMRAMIIQGIASLDYEPPHKTRQATESSTKMSANYENLVDARNRIQEVLTLAHSEVLALAEATKEWHRMEWCLGKKNKKLQKSQYQEKNYRPHGIPHWRADAKEIKDAFETHPDK